MTRDTRTYYTYTRSALHTHTHTHTNVYIIYIYTYIMRDKSPVLGPVVYISCSARGPVLEFATFINFSGAIKSSLEVLAIDEEVYEPDVTRNTQATRTAATCALVERCP